MNVVEYADRDMMAIDVANVLAEELEAALLHHDTVSMAVPGGNTPGAIYDVLCAADVAWDRVHLFLTDERWVSDDDPRSNTRLLRERLMVNRAAAARYLPLYAKADTPEDVLPELEAVIAPELPISILVLGMGTDMHTASMFPGADGLAAAMDPHAPILVPIRSNYVAEPRVTLSARVLVGAMAKHLIITGADKREALERAATLPPEEAPIQTVLNGLTVHWAE